MQSQNKYIGDEGMQKLLDHYECMLPLDVVRMRFAGAACSPNLELTPAMVISSLWKTGKEPRLQTKEEADLFFKFFMGCWDEVYAEVIKNNIKLPSIKQELLNEYCDRRFDELEFGFLEGFWGGKKDFSMPAYVAEIVDSLSDLAKLYQSLRARIATEKDHNNLKSAIKEADKMVEKSISFVVENFVLPRIK